MKGYGVFVERRAKEEAAKAYHACSDCGELVIPDEEWKQGKKTCGSCERERKPT